MGVQQYFLGGNTALGFSSCYDEFCKPEDGNFLWVLKGGPGCGKSTFMRSIGREAENRGLDVEYVLCSGDPDSVDGVMIPELHLGYVDGTAPHTMDVQYPAIRGAYLDLGQFYDLRALAPKADSLLYIYKRYRGEYAASYEALSQTEPAAGTPAARRAGKRRFYDAITCRGILSLPIPVPKQRIDAEEFAALSTDNTDVLLLHPLDPTMLAGIWKTADGVCYTTEPLLPDCAAAIAHLRSAKSLHDELEALYNPHVDFSAVETLAKEHCKKYLQNVLSLREK